MDAKAKVIEVAEKKKLGLRIRKLEKLETTGLRPWGNQDG